MSNKLKDFIIEYIVWSAIFNHLNKYNGTVEEMNVVLGELESLKIKIKKELSK